MARKNPDIQPLDPHFHERLRRAMGAALVYSQVDLMKKLKISRSLANKYWNGQIYASKIRAADLYRIADKLGCSFSWLLTGSGSPTKGRRLGPEEHRVLNILDAFPREHYQWRDAWIKNGEDTLTNLGIKPSTLYPYPVTKGKVHP